MPSHLDKYVQYIRNTGRIGLRVSMFDDDWEPIGPQVRRDLVEAKMITQSGGKIYLPGDVPYCDIGYVGDYFRDETNEERLRRTLEMLLEEMKRYESLGIRNPDWKPLISLGEIALKETKPC